MATYTGTLPKLSDLAGDILNTTALKLAWPLGTPKAKYTYPDGDATEAFKKAIDEVYPTHNKWAKQTGRGASCDVFAGTVIRYSGLDKAFPRGLGDDPKYLLKHSDRWTKTNICKGAEMKPGDVICYQKADKSGHISIVVARGSENYVAEGGYNSKRFGVVAKKAPNYDPKKYKTFGVYRCKAKTREYLQYGDRGVNVRRLQKFIKWFGINLEVDGVFGKKTKAGVVKFQTKCGIKPDGVFGKKSLAAAKKVDTEAPKAIKCIDISNWQGVIPTKTWLSIHQDIPCTIIRSSYTSTSEFKMHKDKAFEDNIKNAHEGGMKVGVYHYSQATSVKEAEKEADFVIKTIKKYKKFVNLPVAFDWEFGSRLNATKAKKLGQVKCMDICNAFCNKIRSAGYETMVYANLSTLNNYISNDLYKHQKIWVAQYSSKCEYKKPHYMWQYTSSAKVKGIKGNVDMSYIYDPTIK